MQKYNATMQKPKREVLESKDMYKVWKKVKEMKNGYKLQAYPIKLENNDFPSGREFIML